MITIRKGIPEDAAAIIDFQQKMAWETEHLTLEPEIITKGVNAVESGIVVASLLITFEWSDWRNTYVWWFQSVYVLPAFRRMGVFRSMYLFIKAEAEKQHVAGLRLYVETNNSRAQKTYEALGMKSEHYTMYEWLKE
jgi:GNAT superfamily N-acetyltransferase